MDVAVDPNSGSLYLAGVINRELVVHVHDRATLAKVATLRVPPRVENIGWWIQHHVMVLDASRRRLYLSRYRDGAYFEFDLMP